MHINIIPVTMTVTYSSTLTNYSNVVNQRSPNESAVKSNTIRIQKIASCCGRVGRGGRSHQGCGGRGSHGGYCRSTVMKNYDWGVTGLNGHTIRVHPAYRF